MSMMKRGFLKFYILKLLSEESLTGYGLMKRIEEETGFWKPSTGSMYPLLQSLEDQDLIAHEGEEERKMYSLTERGRTALTEAYQAKVEILESLQNACKVFGRIFGPEEVESVRKQMHSWFHEGTAHGFENIPKDVRTRVLLLRHTLMSLPYEKLSKSQIQRIKGVVEAALTELGEFID
jgi:PadR family transcriptional regulator PadR